MTPAAQMMVRVGMNSSRRRTPSQAEFGKLRLSGLLAWMLWSGAQIYFLIGFRNRFVVALNWAWSYITFQRGSRLVTGLYARMEDIRQTPRTELRS
jgi:NADH:ubiquinone reductase (H+-translocating)